MIISISNHFKRQENTLSDKHSGSQGSHMQSTENVSKKKKERKKEKVKALCVLLKNIH